MRAFVSTHRTSIRIAVLLGLCVVLVITKGAPRTGTLTQTYGYTFLALLAAIFILDLARTPSKDMVSALLSRTTLRRVGLYSSYSAYVIHKPLHDAIGKPALEALGLVAPAAQSWPLASAYFAVATGLTLVFAAASYHIFEMPFLKLKRYLLASKGAHKTYIP